MRWVLEYFQSQKGKPAEVSLADLPVLREAQEADRPSKERSASDLEQEVRE